MLTCNCTADLGVHTWLLLHVHPHGAPKTGLVTKAADISPTVTEYEALFEAVKYAVLPHLTRTILGEKQRCNLNSTHCTPETSGTFLKSRCYRAVGTLVLQLAPKPRLQLRLLPVSATGLHGVSNSVGSTVRVSASVT